MMKELLIQLSPTSRDYILNTLARLKEEGNVSAITNLKGRVVTWMRTLNWQEKQEAEDQCIRLRMLEVLRIQGRMNVGEILCRIHCGDRSRYRIRSLLDEFIRRGIVEQGEECTFSLA